MEGRRRARTSGRARTSSSGSTRSPRRRLGDRPPHPVLARPDVDRALERPRVEGRAEPEPAVRLTTTSSPCPPSPRTDVWTVGVRSQGGPVRTLDRALERTRVEGRAEPERRVGRQRAQGHRDDVGRERMGRRRPSAGPDRFERWCSRGTARACDGSSRRPTCRRPARTRSTASTARRPSTTRWAGRRLHRRHGQPEPRDRTAVEGGMSVMRRSIGRVAGSVARGDRYARRRRHPAHVRRHLSVLGDAAAQPGIQQQRPARRDACSAPATRGRWARDRIRRLPPGR